MALAIQFENVFKRYRLGGIGTGTFSRDLERAWMRLRGKPDPFSIIGATDPHAGTGREFVWALQDLSLDVVEGETLGIVGRNGAGKSTLLKLLSKVTAPTRGYIRSKGTVASLLEVGTGFHPEFTGLENIYLNGVILGMKRSEIRERLDDIIAFSGCARYIDTPVKRYSSGMIVRLGFAVAAHLACDTIVVDEVLAVGDADFQQKCISKMGEISRTGRTILLVSHNMGTVARLCDRCAILDQGKLSYLGKTDVAIEKYLAESSGLPAVADLSQWNERRGSGRARFRRFWLENARGTPCSTVASGQRLSLCFLLERKQEPVAAIDVGFSIHDALGETMTGLYSSVVGSEFSLTGSELLLRCYLDQLPLPPGRYTIAIRMVAKNEELDWPRGMVASFEVVEGDFYGTGRAPLHENVRFLLAGEWVAEAQKKQDEPLP